LNNDFLDMLSTLSEEGAEYLLVGAYALAVHGLPRATGDLDIWIRTTPENRRRVWRARPVDLRTLLISLGWRRASPSRRNDPRQGL
jgi:hypothetical protein